MESVDHTFDARVGKRVVDALGAGAAFYLAYQVRFEWQVPAVNEHQMWMLLGPVMLGQVLVNWLAGTYRLVWRYIDLEDAARVTRSYAAFSAVLLVIFFVAPERWAVVQIPRSIIVIQFLLSVVAALGARGLRRAVHEGLPAKKTPNGEPVTRVALIGAGHVGVAVARQISAQAGFKVVGFVDDDPQKKSAIINGLPVLGPVDALPCVVEQHQVTEVVVCISRVSRAFLRQVWSLCDQLPVRIKIVPGIEEILHGKINPASFREVEMSDLLGRESLAVSDEPREVACVYQGKRILITGAGGSIGSELARQLARLHPSELILLDKDENSLHDVWLGVASQANGAGVHPVVADLRFAGRLGAIMATHRPEIIFHAAAHKHVHLMEANPCEAILNNVSGTRNLVEKSVAAGVGRFILISTDKAVKPTCVMGASKRVCEMLAQMQPYHRSRICCVRFGNVLGSRGSVVPVFQKQIAGGQAVTVTHAGAQRFLMTIPEAVCLLIRAGTLASGGETFVLDMGQPVLIRDLAKDLIELSGLRPERDVPITFTQLHDGEKLNEQLFDENCEKLLPTRFPGINVIHSSKFNAAQFAEKLTALEQAAQRDSPRDVFTLLGQLNIGFNSQTVAEPAAFSTPLQRVAVAAAGK